MGKRKAWGLGEESRREEVEAAPYHDPCGEEAIHSTVRDNPEIPVRMLNSSFLPGHCKGRLKPKEIRGPVPQARGWSFRTTPGSMLPTYKKKKINAQCESCEFFSGQNEDCGLGDSTSHRSERLLQRGGGKVRISVILVKVEYTQSCAYFSRSCY